MKITPIEIKQKNFSVKSFGKGFDREEVQIFLAMLAEEWSAMNEQNTELRIKSQLLEKEIQKLKEVESSLFRTLKTAEDTSTNIVEQARKTAELKVKEAQMKADVIINDARTQAKEIVRKSQDRARQVLEEVISEMKDKKQEYREVENYRDNFLFELKNFMQGSLEKVGQFESKHGTLASIDQKISKVQDYLEEKHELIDQQNVIREQEQLIMAAQQTTENIDQDEDEELSPSATKLDDDEDEHSFFDDLKA